MTHRIATLRDGTQIVLWDFDSVEIRLQDAMTTLRRIPFPKNGAPRLDRSHWPEVVRSMADRAGWIVGADSLDHLLANEADRNRVRFVPSSRQVHAMEECLEWLHHIKDRRHRKVVFARSHVHPDSGRHFTKYTSLARHMGVHQYTLRRWYRDGIIAIVRALNA